MLNDVANMTLSYRNMVLFVCDQIGSIVLLLVLVCILLFSNLISNCINNALTIIKKIMPLQRASILISVYFFQTIPLSSHDIVHLGYR